jgi:hypothetical protein
VIADFRSDASGQGPPPDHGKGIGLGQVGLGRLLLTAQQVCFPCLLSDNRNHDFTSHCKIQDI